MDEEPKNDFEITLKQIWCSPPMCEVKTSLPVLASPWSTILLPVAVSVMTAWISGSCSFTTSGQRYVVSTSVSLGTVTAEDVWATNRVG